MKLNDLLDSKHFVFEEYLDAQKELLDQGLLFKVNFKKKIYHFKGEKIAKTIIKNFIGTGPLVNFYYEDSKYFHVDAENEVDIVFFSDFGSKEIKLNHTPLKISTFWQTNDNFNIYITDLDFIKEINNNKYFYIKINGLKTPEYDINKEFNNLNNDVCFLNLKKKIVRISKEYKFDEIQKENLNRYNEFIQNIQSEKELLNTYLMIRECLNSCHKIGKNDIVLKKFEKMQEKVSKQILKCLEEKKERQASFKIVKLIDFKNDFNSKFLRIDEVKNDFA